MKRESRRMSQRLIVLVAVALATSALHAQTPEPKPQVPKVVPVPPLHRGASAQEPNDPPPQDVTDARDHLSFHLPAAWNLSREDGEISSFHLDARTAPRKSQLRMVASLAFNPYPQSTFEGALFYVSSTPNISAAACAMQTATKPFQVLPPATIDDVKFARGKDEHGKICTEARDVAYTALRHGSCLRFDLAINSFCGGEVSGAQDLSATQLGALYQRLETILVTVHFTK
jgi:hypothetical protein